MGLKRRRKNRLAPDIYCGRRIYFITIVTAGRKPVFVAADELVAHHLDILGSTSDKRTFDVITYCYMPDHLHLLVSGRDEKSNLIGLLKTYKQITGYYHKKRTDEVLWQKGYYDHVLRKQEAIFETARYILANPVRKGLVEQPAAYPYAGSIFYGTAVFTM